MKSTPRPGDLVAIYCNRSAPPVSEGQVTTEDRKRGTIKLRTEFGDLEIPRTEVYRYPHDMRLTRKTGTKGTRITRWGYDFIRSGGA